MQYLQLKNTTLIHHTMVTTLTIIMISSTPINLLKNNLCPPQRTKHFINPINHNNHNRRPSNKPPTPQMWLTSPSTKL